MSSDLVVEEVICDARIDENGDGLLFKKSSNFHRLRVGVAGQRVHYIVGRLGLFLYGFIFGFEALFRWFTILILYWFNHEKLALFEAMFSAPWLANKAKSKDSTQSTRTRLNWGPKRPALFKSTLSSRLRLLDLWV
ncbi:hypothetical protein BHE74_00046619 [Ensete ventricosum]|nr:hypothetical protein GW17_00058513 [Ensete ventricosum]RWW47391.1 hypothetical protein BHE74_00046619 [Ensete ventricosum]RZS19329.1 hypothetical protein BHM03_00051707 [Ensete ventricosum]